jgi:DNA repair exonuclease SbcCD ATPase subunit
MILFKQIRFKNILSFGNTWTEIQLCDASITLIRGKNGSGKSGAILDTICFALFGKPFRKINKPQLVNYRNKSEMVVEITFESKGKEILVRRGQNPGLFEIYQNGVLKNQDSTIRDYQGWFEQNILQFDFNAFTQIVILGKASFVSFMRLGLDQRRKFVENILGLNIFSVMGELHKANVSALKDEIKDLKTELILLKERRDIHETYIKKLKIDKKNSEKDEKSRIKTLEEKLQAEIAEIEAQLNIENKKKIQVDQAEKENLVQMERKYNSLVSRADEKSAHIKRNLKFFNENENCPTCNQQIAPHIKQEQIDDSKAKLENLNKIIIELKNKSIDTQTNIKRLNRLIEESHQLGKSIDRLNTRKVEIEKQIKDMHNYHTKKSGVQDQIQIVEQEKLLEELSNKYEEVLDRKSKLLDQQEYYDLVTTMLKDTGVKRMMIGKFIPFLNSAINANLKKLGFFIKLSFDENFNETILARGIDELSYFNYSEGEKLRIDLAILMAWREVAKIQNNMNTNLLIFDEIFDSSLDSGGTTLFLELLADLDQTNVFIITPWNDSLDPSKVKENLFFEKQNGFSKKMTNFLTTGVE